MLKCEQLELDLLEKGLPGITPAIGSTLIEGCVVSLMRQKHVSGVHLKVDADIRSTYSLTWKNDFTEQLDNSWKDQIVATEYGAVCLSILLVLKLTDYTVIKRACRPSGFDYWLGNKTDIDTIFQEKARLEISGIFEGDVTMINARVKEKLNQTNRSDNTKLPAFVCIVEFKKPMAKMVKKNDNI